MSNLSSHERQNSLCCDGDDSSSREISWKTEVKGWISDLHFIAAWKVYLHQRVVLAGVALALLFFTVLSFGTLVTATLEWKGIPTFITGGSRGISAMVGTISYPKFLSTSTLRAGLWFIWSQWICLLGCVASIWVSNGTYSASRLLYGCVVEGAQNALQSVMDLMSYVMAMIVSNPQDFWKLILISFVMVTMATFHLLLIRKYISHAEKLISMCKWSVSSS